MNLTLRMLALGLTLTLGGAAAQQVGDSAQVGTPPSTRSSFQLPTDYLNRFASTGLLASSYDGFGVRYFPLPFQQDIRLTLAKRPKYWEYNLTTRYKDTTFGIGVFDNGPTAAEGVARLEATHDPDTGWQYGARLQKSPYLSRISAGYALRTWENRIRVLNNVGVGIISDGSAHVFTESIASGGYAKPLSPQVTARIDATARLYGFPLDGKAEASVDLVPGVSFNPLPNLNIDVAHLERLAPESVPPIPDFNFNRYSESYLVTTYRPSGDENFSVGLVRGALTKNWVGDSKATTVRGEVLLRTKLPALVGGSLGYRWGASPADSRWTYGLAFGPK